jgi:MerR HTH family regulatory protein
VPTIKYCPREGLPRPGELTSPDQAQYDESYLRQLRQLRLIRGLAEVGGLSIAAIGDLLAASGSPGTSLHDAPGKAQYATTPRYGHPAGDRVPAGRRPPGRRAHPRPRLTGQAGHPGPGTAHRRPGRPA